MIDIVMPQMGESIVEGTVTKWHKQVGDSVDKDEALFEISTDKVDSDVPAIEAGVIAEILVQEGETAEINTVVARLTAGDSAPPAPARAAKAAPAPVSAPEPAPAPPAAASSTVGSSNGERVKASPLVRRIAREKGIDLSQVSGSGQGGRISKKDLDSFTPPAASPARAASPVVADGSHPALMTFPPAPDARFGNHKVERLSTMRKRIAEHMVRSMHQTAPHVSMVHQFDCTRIVEARAAAKEKFLKLNGAKLTFMPFFMRAAIAALKEFPMVNASLDGEEIVYHNDINLGIAVALDWGLMVPVIKNAELLNIVGLQKSLNDVAGRAREKQLKPDELQQSTFSISNYGGFGSIFATPAINQPNSALLGLGALHKEPVVINDAIAIRTVCYGTLTIDHRLVDGALAAQFMEHMRGVLENWSESVL